MFQDELIDMLKRALEKANAPNATPSDFDNAIMVFLCISTMRKEKIIQVDEIYAALEAEIKKFFNSQTFSERTKGGTLPTSNTRDIVEGRIDFQFSLVHEVNVDLTQMKVDFGNIS